MAIDIDKFLKNYEEKLEEKNHSKPEEKEEMKIDLDINKVVTDKFSKLKESSSLGDFSFLLNAYEEIKKFDENLPNRLYQISGISGSALKDVGSKYSKQFLNSVSQITKQRTIVINQHFKSIDKALSENQIKFAVNIFNEVTNIYKKFPKEFVLERIELGKELRKRELIINEKFDLFWKKEVFRIKNQIKVLVSDLKKELVPSNISKIEEKLNAINILITQIPNLFFSEFLKERNQIAKIMIQAEDFLKDQYVLEFNKKENQLHELFDRFHRYQLKKDVHSALATYDEMIVTFSKMPDVFLDKKIIHYEEITKYFELTNSLLLRNNINTFVDTYNYSKLIDQARDYIDFTNATGKSNLSNLIALKENLNKISDTVKPEKRDIEIKLDNMISKFSQKSESMKVVQETSQDVSSMVGSETSTQNRKPVDNLITQSMKQKFQKNSTNESIAVEIEENFKKIIECDEKDKVVKLVKKINFYIKLLPLSQTQIHSIEQKIHETLKSKTKG